MRLDLVAVMVALLAISACSGEVGSSSVAQTSSSTSTSASHSSLPSLADSDCSAPADKTLTDIASVVAWINAMPKPLTLACFVKSIPRPVYYNATVSTFSAQPSIGRRSPRVFFQVGDLLLTMVPDEMIDDVKNPITGKNERIWDADQIQLLELSFKVPSDVSFDISIKAEIKFPIADALPATAPYAHLNFTEKNSVCSVCHGYEREQSKVDGQPVYSSKMLRGARASEVFLEPMLNEYSTCDPTISVREKYRCEMLDAIYGQGILVWWSFPEEMPLIGN